MKNLFYDLPLYIINLIYTFDPTYKIKYDNVVNYIKKFPENRCYFSSKKDNIYYLHLKYNYILLFSDNFCSKRSLFTDDYYYLTFGQAIKELNQQKI
jgi:hypothetical protein